MNIAFQLTLHDYSACADVGFHAPVRSDGQTVSFRVDGALYLAIYIKVFTAREFPFNHNRLAASGHFPAGSIRRFERFHECSPLGNCSESLILLQCVRLHGGRGRVPGRAVWKRCRELMEAARAPAASQRVQLLVVQVVWLGPLKCVENAPKNRCPARLFPSQSYAKSATCISRKIRDPTTQNP